jgi:hypothetical protein
MSRSFLFAAVLLCVASAVSANPIPPPGSANMVLEDMFAEINPGDAGQMVETFYGFYYFDRIDPSVMQMEYPLPPRNRDFSIYMGKLPEDWRYSDSIFPSLHEAWPDFTALPWTVLRKLYPTVVPEWPWIPVNGWWGPAYGSFPPKALFHVKYHHDLLSRGREYVYFYALGSGKGQDDVGHGTVFPQGLTSFLDIRMPGNLNVVRMTLDYDMQPFTVTTEQGKTVVSFYGKSLVGSFKKDLIATIRPWCLTSDVNYDDKTDVLDLVRVRNQLGKAVSDEAAEAADVNGDGVVNVLDLVAVRNHLGENLQTDAAARPIAPPQIRLRYSVKQCGTTMPPIAKPNVFVQGNSMVVSDSIYFNCCPEYVRMAIMVEGNTVIFREKAMEKDPCKCMCSYPMKGVAGPFAPGKYT